MSDSATHNPRALWWTHGLMLLAAGLVSTSFIVGKAIAEGLDPAVLTLIRFSLAALLFSPYIHMNHGLRMPGFRSFARYSVISGALVAFFWLMFLSLRYTTALNTGVIFTLVPGISGIYSALLLRERLGKHRLAALILAMTGALWVIFHGDFRQLLALQLNRGDLIFFTGCLFMGLYTPLIKLLHRGEPMAVMTFWVLITGSCWLLVLAGHRLVTIPWAGVALQTWAGVIYLAVFCTIITFFLTQFSTVRIGPTRVMAYSYLYPPLVLLLNFLLGQPLPSGQTMLGVAVIVPCLIIVQKGAGEI